MIKSLRDYKYYYEQDLKLSGISNRSKFFRLKDRRHKFYKSLRITEFFINCTPKYLSIVPKILILRHTRICNKYQWTIPPNVFGPGLAIVHVGTIVVSGNAKVGKNCRIHVCVNVGNAYAKGESGAPIIGDNVYIGPGAKIFGPIIIGNNIAIGANSVVNSSFLEGDCTIAGIPAKKISSNTSKLYIEE